MNLSRERRAEIEEVYGPLSTWKADTALSFIKDQVRAGLTPVMAGTRYYRHSFVGSQFGSYLYYLDERGTKGACQAKNVVTAFDFMPMGSPVAGSQPSIEMPVQGRAGMVGIVVPGERQPSLLEAAEAAIAVMHAGPERDNLADAVARERRIH